MSERTLVVDHLKFHYEGLCNIGELYTFISTWFYEKGWDWYEKLNEEMGHSVILITHETYTAEHAERIINIHDGKIKSDNIVKNRRKIHKHLIK